MPEAFIYVLNFMGLHKRFTVVPLFRKGSEAEHQMKSQARYGRHTAAGTALFLRVHVFGNYRKLDEFGNILYSCPIKKQTRAGSR